MFASVLVVDEESVFIYFGMGVAALCVWKWFCGFVVWRCVVLGVVRLVMVGILSFLLSFSLWRRCFPRGYDLDEVYSCVLAGNPIVSTPADVLHVAALAGSEAAPRTFPLPLGWQ